MTSRPPLDVTTGPIFPAAFKLAWPILMSMLMEFTLAITNVFWVGQLGPRQQDAMTSATIVMWSLFAAMSLVTIGVNAFVSQNVGARDPLRAGFVAKRGLMLAAMCGVLFGALGFISAPALLQFMEAEEQVAVYGVEFLRIFFLGAPLLTVLETLSAVFRATGDSRTPMLVSVVTVVCNLILDPLLIFGVGPFPEMGVSGAALGTCFSLALGLLLYWYLSPRRLSIPLRSEGVDPWRVSGEIIRLGAPIATHQMTFILVYWFIIQVVHHFGFVAGAALGIGNRLEAINYLLSSALAVAASTIVGQNIGANNPDRAERAAWVTVGLGALITGAISIVFLVIPGQLADIFTNESAVRVAASRYIVIVGLSQIFMALEIIIDGAFAGAGNTLPPMIISIPGAIIRIPLASYLAIDRGLGIDGVWWTISLTCMAKGVILAIWFKRGRWKRQSLVAHPHNFSAPAN